MRRKLRFVDLFAGLGGFHVALDTLGHQCVFACEIDDELRTTYAKNFGLDPHTDIRSIRPEQVPKHDILCAGFPCQPFSKAGLQEGLKCPTQGDLIGYVIAILEHRKPKFFILENVPNLLRHAGGATYRHIKKRLQRIGYAVDQQVMSPHQFGIPQIRQRAYIVGKLDSLEAFCWPARSPHPRTSIDWILDTRPKDFRPLGRNAIAVLNAWQNFLELHPTDREFPSFPIWSMEFGATYPYEEESPFVLGTRRLAKYRGAFGVKLSDLAPSDRIAGLPRYAQATEAFFPDWKIAFIRKNRNFYSQNRKWIDGWLPSVRQFHSSHQKLEWNCKGSARDIWSHLIQFRASGVRVKQPTSAPALVALTTTQVPVVGWQRRYLTARECSRLQCLDSLKHLPERPTKAFRALGNAVNSEMVRLVAEKLIEGNSQEQSKPTKKNSSMPMKAG